MKNFTCTSIDSLRAVPAVSPQKVLAETDGQLGGNAALPEESTSSVGVYPRW